MFFMGRCICLGLGDDHVVGCPLYDKDNFVNVSDGLFIMRFIRSMANMYELDPSLRSGIDFVSLQRSLYGLLKFYFKEDYKK